MIAGSRALRVLARALDEHAASLAACRRCAFGDPAVRPIVSAARAPLAMLVGQAPGKTETVDQRPFAGRAGRTLFRWLAEAGIREEVARRRIYIAAMTRCYPGPDPSGRGDRVPSRQELANCAGWLDAELALVRPGILIPVGRLAIARFFGDAPLAGVVGRAHTLEPMGRSCVAIPLPHPSGASSWIHQPGNQARVRRAIRLIARHLPELVRESGSPFLAERR